MLGIHLHECDEQEEGIGRPPDLLIEKPGQKGEDSILGGTAKKGGNKREVSQSLRPDRVKWRKVMN